MLFLSKSFVALSRFGRICQNNDVAAVVGDEGLQTAYLIAHEVARK